jgi:predicted regulator of Ras-like GTPase activity (Roadblock/LC7/MglB family)
MNEILEELNERVGIKGSLVVTEDGIIITSAFRTPSDEERVAALAHSFISSSKTALLRCGLKGFTRCELTADYGKMIILDLGVSFLVVVTDRKVDFSSAIVDIQSAAKRIRRLGTIQV